MLEPTNDKVCGTTKPVNLYRRLQRQGYYWPDMARDAKAREEPCLKCTWTPDRAECGRTLRRNPWVFGALDSHQCLRYSSRHSRFRFVYSRSRGCIPLRRASGKGQIDLRLNAPTSTVIREAFGKASSL
ncbi:hypothetical protein V6N11_057984 [Hibiscus sabdariffa]|uniref:Integrase zinc-binding domain-containing protein n=2 Tax=Hibiscus sabdariffa TaxID=183260 RepID=A0ABR2B689_9ROSI